MQVCPRILETEQLLCLADHFLSFDMTTQSAIVNELRHCSSAQCRWRHLLWQTIQSACKRLSRRVVFVFHGLVE